jgi:hypothetical protein
VSKEKAAARLFPARRRQKGGKTKSVARWGTDSDLVRKLLADPALGFKTAQKLFPGTDPPESYLRAALTAIVAAQAHSADAAVNLAELREIGTVDWQELEDSLMGETIIEIGLREAVRKLEAALFECRAATKMLRRTRASRRRPRRDGS